MVRYNTYKVKDFLSRWQQILSVDEERKYRAVAFVQWLLSGIDKKSVKKLLVEAFHQGEAIIVHEKKPNMDVGYCFNTRTQKFEISIYHKLKYIPKDIELADLIRCTSSSIKLGCLNFGGNDNTFQLLPPENTM